MIGLQILSITLFKKNLIILMEKVKVKKKIEPKEGSISQSFT